MGGSGRYSTTTVLRWPSLRTHIAQGTRAYKLFATHYFELTALAEPGSGIANVHLDAVEHGDALVFMHAVKDGPADRSFGLQVAALAGLPKSVVRQARGRLAELEQHSRDNPQPALTPAALDAPQQFGLFAAPSAALDAWRDRTDNSPQAGGRTPVQNQGAGRADPP